MYSGCIAEYIQKKKGTVTKVCFLNTILSEQIEPLIHTSSFPFALPSVLFFALHPHPVCHCHPSVTTPGVAWLCNCNIVLHLPVLNYHLIPLVCQGAFYYVMDRLVLSLHHWGRSERDWSINQQPTRVEWVSERVSGPCVPPVRKNRESGNWRISLHTSDSFRSTTTYWLIVLYVALNSLLSGRIMCQGRGKLRVALENDKAGMFFFNSHAQDDNKGKVVHSEEEREVN